MSGLLCLTWNNHYSAFLKLLSNLHLKDLYCDTTIACHGKYYPAHRLVLSTCSEYFEEIFAQNRCKHPYIIVKDVKPPELEALLNYMYKGEVNVSQEFLPELIKAAEGLKIKGLAVPDDTLPDKLSNENEKKRSTDLSSPSQPKKKRVYEEKRKKESQSSEENNINKPKQFGGSSNVEQTESSLPYEEESQGQGLNVNEISAQQNTSGQEIKVEAEDIGSYEDNLFSSHESDLNKKDSIHSSFQSGTFPTSEESDQQDNTQFESQTTWVGSGDEKREKELQIPLEIPEVDFGVYAETIDGNFASNSERVNIRLDASNTTDASIQRYSVPGSATKWFRCSYCLHENKTYSGMKLHLLYKHSNQEKPFACKMCPYRCFFKGDLRKHIRKHTGEKPFKCTLCSYSATQKHHLDNHLRTHTGEKPLVCPHCPYRGNTRYNYEHHLLKHRITMEQ